MLPLWQQPALKARMSLDKTIRGGEKGGFTRVFEVFLYVTG